ncbi:CocE/NonD family hydrolase [Sphingomonas sp. DT-204]|uniref:CocE/NonD family hydrolase n=1 Tax=Sphingomonas sp. DT-204 TaxID=3396166 RepID=UPI003F1B9931
MIRPPRWALGGALAALTLSLAPPQPLPAQVPAAAPAEARFHYREVMVPMRDGVRLQTAIFTPLGRRGPLPILLRRTPYGVPGGSWTLPYGMRHLAADGYVIVVQNLRGRFKSEGRFSLAESMRLAGGTTVEARDAWDTIDWLVRNVPDNNGRVGIYGVSYDGLTAAAALIDPHPALKAVSEQASPADQWMNDDDHRYGALRLSYAFEYATMVESDRHANAQFAFDTWDAYDWYLKLGPLSTINGRYLRGSIPFWNDIVAHPNYDAFWKGQAAWMGALGGTRVPVLNVAGFWDQEDPWGPWQIHRRLAARDPERLNLMVAGPWNHGGWRRPAPALGPIPLGEDVSLAYLRDVEAPFFAHWLHGKGVRPDWAATIFQTGSNRWRRYAQWPPVSRATKLYLHADGRLDFTAPGAAERGARRRYVSDPANPVPYRQRPISPTYPGGDWRNWEMADQRFADRRPDVLSFATAPLDRDLVVTGEVAAKLFAATSGTDSDFIVKLIDVFPEDAAPPPWTKEDGPPPGAYAQQINGYQLPIAMEVRRGRFLESFETPTALVPNRPLPWDVPLRARDHVFRKGHRIMVQIQSSWFPLIDRNPQTFMPSIFAARAKDYVAATQTVFTSPDFPSHIVLPVVDGN